ncbi:MAG: RIP metalloprotease RseP [Gammaproteobacteria bacterium]
MSHIIISALAFLAAIAILIPFHEFGHFWVARKLGVKVQRFAVGFGKVLLSRRAKDGVEYCLCAIPLGGYVKMLDEREGTVSTEDLPFAFNRQPVWKRFLIVLAGPVFNLILAVILCMGVFLIGFDGPIPIMNAPAKGSLALHNGLKAHDEVIAIDGRKTPTVINVRHIWSHYLKEPSVTLTIKRDGKLETVLFKQPLIIPGTEEDFLDMLGMDFKQSTVLGKVTPDSPAMKAGLLEGDKVVRVNDVTVMNWDELVQQISQHPHVDVPMEIKREGKLQKIHVTPAARPDGTGMIGVHLPRDVFRRGSFGVQDSITEAFRQTYKMVIGNVKMLAYMATGRASFDNISGPVTIARAAGESVEEGSTAYLYFLAMISVGLAVLNLLPIPVLDGGHLLFYVIEMVLRRPLSEHAQEIGFRIGILLLLGLMLIALYNDMMHVW